MKKPTAYTSPAMKPIGRAHKTNPGSNFNLRTVAADNCKSIQYGSMAFDVTTPPSYGLNETDKLCDRIASAVNEYDVLKAKEVEHHNVLTPLANATRNYLDKYGNTNFERVRNAGKLLAVYGVLESLVQRGILNARNDRAIMARMNMDSNPEESQWEIDAKAALAQLAKLKEENK